MSSPRTDVPCCCRCKVALTEEERTFFEDTCSACEQATSDAYAAEREQPRETFADGYDWRPARDLS
jgi:hypothetical protein